MYNFIGQLIKGYGSRLILVRVWLVTMNNMMQEGKQTCTIK